MIKEQHIMATHRFLPREVIMLLSEFLDIVDSRHYKIFSMELSRRLNPVINTIVDSNTLLLHEKVSYK